MSKTLSDRIATRAAKQKPKKGARNRAAFLALREDIRQALADGWPVKSIWETLHEEGKVDFSYQAFRGYANRLILAAKPPPGAPSPSPPATPSTTPPTSAPPAPATPPRPASQPARVAPAGFSFNPVPNKEELL